jgi:hypothetical protein
MKETLGTLMSQFVGERMAPPSLDTIDSWVEVVAAGLFTTGVSLVLLSKEAQSSLEAMEHECNSFCKDAATHTSQRMNQSLQPKGFKSFFGKGSLSFDFRGTLLSRLVGYFEIYFSLMEESDISYKEARWQTLRRGLELASEHLLENELISKSQQFPWIEQIVKQCKALVQDLPEYAR